MGQNFAEFTLSGTVFEIQAFLCFAIFAQNSKWPPFLVGQKLFENWVSYSAVTLRFKIFIEITLSTTVFEIQAFLSFTFFKNSKWPTFLPSEIFVETWKG